MNMRKGVSMNKRQQLSVIISDLKGKVHNAGDRCSPWSVYDAEDVDNFIKKVLEIFKK